MNYESIDNILTANERIRDAFKQVAAGVDQSEAVKLPEGEKWTIQQIAEHVAIVDEGAAKICAKLLAEAREAGRASDGRFEWRDELAAKTAEIADVKIEAPERVHPTGQVPIASSIERMEKNGEFVRSMREDLSRFDLADAKFPHPFLGDMTAAEWLVVAGGHQMRHARQIERVLEKIRQ